MKVFRKLALMLIAMMFCVGLAAACGGGDGSLVSIVFAPNGGNEVNAATIYVGGKLTEPEPPVRNGYVFDAWYTSNTTFTEETKYSFDSYVWTGFTLYANWTLAEYTITYENLLDGTNPNTFTTYTIESSTITFAAPVRNGFNGSWDISSIPQGSYGNKTITAIWSEKSFIVVLDKQGGTGGTNQFSILGGANLPAITAPTRAGFVFGGYYSEINGGGKQYYNALLESQSVWDIDSTSPKLYAKWNSVPVTLSFNGNGQTSGKTSNITAQSGSVATMPASGFSKTAYVFAGWNTAEDGSGTTYVAASGFTVPYSANPIQFYAQWEPAPVIFSGWEDSGSRSVRFSGPNGGATANGGTITYALKSGSSLPEGLSLNATNGRVSGTVTARVDTYTFVIIATCEQTGASAEATFTFTVLGLPITVKQPTFAGGTIQFGDPYPTITTTTTDGTLVLDAGQVLKSGTHEYNWTFTPDDSDYMIARGTIELTVATVADPTCSVTTLTYGDSLPVITTTTMGGSIALDAGQTLTAGTKNYGWTFIPDDSNYAPVTGVISLTVQKANQATPVGVDLDASMNASSVVTLTNLGTAYEYSMDGTTWQDAHTFNGVAPGEYTFYARLKATANLNASAAISVTKTLTVTQTNIFTRSGGTITGLTTSGKSTQHLVIPTEISGVKITAIADYAFQDCTAMRSATIPSGVTIGYGAFYGCNNMTDITFSTKSLNESSLNYVFSHNTPSKLVNITITDGEIPSSMFSWWSNIKTVTLKNGVTKIGSYAFQNCTNLTDVTIGNGVTEIEYSVFYGCVSLINVSFGNNVTTIGYDLFYNCTSLKTIVFLDGVTHIPSNMFSGITTLTNITIPDSVYSIGQDAFKDTAWLTAQANGAVYAGKVLYAYKGTMPAYHSLVIAEGTVGIAANTFNGQTRLYTITLPESIRYIGNSAFYGCSNLSAAALPASLKEIGAYAFYNCDGISVLTIPAAVEAIGEQAFYDMDNLISVEFEADSQVTELKSNLFDDCGKLKTVILPQGLIKIGYRAFSYCYALTEMVLPDSIREIGQYAFAWMGGSAIKSITLPEGMTEIGDYAFYGSPFTTMKLPSTLTRIGAYAFASSSYLSNIQIPDSVEELGDNVFQSCSNLTVYMESLMPPVRSGAFTSVIKIYVPKSALDSYKLYWSQDTDKIYAYEILDGGFMIDDSGVLIQYHGSDSALVIPEEITAIGNSAFSGLQITSLTIPESVKTIGSYAFSDCAFLTEINFNATAMTDPSYYANIFQNAGHSGDGIVVNIGANVTKIPSYLFNPSYDSSTAPKITSVVFAENSVCESIGEYAFYYCVSLESIVLPESIETIGDYAFYYCVSLESIVLPESIETIGDRAFYGCSSLTSITIPESVKTIESYAFSDCILLTEIKFNAVAMNDTSGNMYIFQNAGHSGDGIVVNIGANVTKIPSYLFNPNDSSSTAPKIMNVVFAENSVCESIGNYAFRYCSTLTSVTIPESVKTIERYAFSDCILLTEINFNAVAMNDTSGNMYIFQNAGHSGDGIVVNIGANVTKIPSYLFNPNDSSSTAPRITSVVFAENSVCESIGNYAFYYCVSLESIVLPESVKTIDYYAFYGCSSLTSVTIPENVESIGNWAFGDCAFLTEINFNAIEMDDVSYGPSIFRLAGQNGDGIVVNIGANVTKIPSYLFTSYSTDAPNVVAIVFAENSVCESIGNRAFYGCSSLTSVTIPESVKTIDDYAFYNCTALSIVYYGGTDFAAWNAISISYDNSLLTNATRYYYSATPVYDGSHWRYEDGIPTVWEN